MLDFTVLSIQTAFKKYMKTVVLHFCQLSSFQPDRTSYRVSRICTDSEKSICYTTEFCSHV